MGIFLRACGRSGFNLTAIRMTTTCGRLRLGLSSRLQSLAKRMESTLTEIPKSHQHSTSWKTTVKKFAIASVALGTSIYVAHESWMRILHPNLNDSDGVLSADLKNLSSVRRFSEREKSNSIIQSLNGLPQERRIYIIENMLASKDSSHVPLHALKNADSFFAEELIGQLLKTQSGLLCLKKIIAAIVQNPEQTSPMFSKQLSRAITNMPRDLKSHVLHTLFPKELVERGLINNFDKFCENAGAMDIVGLFVNPELCSPNFTYSVPTDREWNENKDLLSSLMNCPGVPYEVQKLLKWCIFLPKLDLSILGRYASIEDLQITAGAISKWRMKLELFDILLASQMTLGRANCLNTIFVLLSDKQLQFVQREWGARIYAILSFRDIDPAKWTILEKERIPHLHLLQSFDVLDSSWQARILEVIFANKHKQGNSRLPIMTKIVLHFAIAQQHKGIYRLIDRMTIEEWSDALMAASNSKDGRHLFKIKPEEIPVARSNHQQYLDILQKAKDSYTANHQMHREVD